MYMKPLMFVLIFLVAGCAKAGGWQAIGDIEHLGDFGKTVRSMSKISNVVRDTPYHGNPNVGAFNRAVGDTRNFPKARQLKDVPYVIQQGQNILR